jgi:multidrug efflux pump
VDDAIVVIENVTRHLERGVPPLQAALIGAKEIGFTVLSISISLVAVFIPLLLMGGIVGRLFREFAVTLSAAILVSLVVSLTATPMMCSKLLKHQQSEDHGRLYRASEKVFDQILRIYDRSLTWVLRHPAPTLAVLLLTIGVNLYLLSIVPKGFFPQQDTGRIRLLFPTRFGCRATGRRVRRDCAVCWGSFLRLKPRRSMVHFAEPGTYLVICGVLPHFQAGMYGFVRVLP